MGFANHQVLMAYIITASTGNMHVASVKWYTTQLCAVHIIFSRKCRQTAQLITFLDTFDCSALVWSCSLCSWILPLPCSIKIFSWLYNPPYKCRVLPIFTVFLKFHVQTALLHCRGHTKGDRMESAVFGITLC